MSDDVEIIEICPEIIEISDETDEDCKDFIDISYYLEESADVTVSTRESENQNEICEVQVVEVTDNQTTTCARNASNSKFKNYRRKKRKRRRRVRKRPINPVNGNEALLMDNIPNGIYDKVARSCATLSPEDANQLIKQENESTIEIISTDEETTLNIANTSEDVNNASQNTLVSNKSNSNQPSTSSSTTVPPRENPSTRLKNYDYSKLKWLKPLNNLSSPTHLQLVIIDRNHPDWKIRTEKWLMIEKRLLESLHCEMLRTNDRSIGLFDGAKWQKGIKIVGCHNEKAFNFIKNFILNLDKLWSGAKLDVFSMANIVRQICKVFIPPPILQTDIVLSLIKLQNPNICSEDWEVLGQRERNYGIDIWLSVSEQSLQYLYRSRGEVKYGINRIFVNPVF